RKRYGEKLLHRALAAVNGRLNAVGRIEPMAQRKSELILRYCLARVELDGLRRGLPRILLQLGAIEPRRVLGLRLAQRVGHQRERGVGVELVFQLAIDVIAVRLAVLPVTLGMEVRRIDYAVERSPLPAELRRFAPGAVAAEQQRGLEGRRRRTVLRLDADHASCRIAVKTGERPAQHLDALRRAERESRRLPLPVGHACRNAVGDEADAAHAEGRAGAEAARGDLQVLGVV